MTNQVPIEDKRKALVRDLLIVALVGGVFVVILSLAIKAIFFQTSEPEIQKVVEKVIEEKKVILRAPKCEQSFEEYQKLVESKQTVKLVQNLNTYAAAGKLVNTKNIIVARSGTGEIACGYLYVKSHLTSGMLDERFDSTYINPQDFGGHLLRPRGLKISEEKKFTHFLFPLETIYYLPTVPYNPQSQNFKIADWTKLLNVTNEVKFILGLSVLDPSAILDEVTIAYRCWDPQTGEETTGCQLGVK